jgi:hypothetical protein
LKFNQLEFYLPSVYWRAWQNEIKLKFNLSQFSFISETLPTFWLVFTLDAGNAHPVFAEMDGYLDCGECFNLLRNQVVLECFSSSLYASINHNVWFHQDG